MVVLGPKDMEHATAEDEVVFAPGALGQRSSDAGRARTRAARKGFAAAALVHASFRHAYRSLAGRISIPASPMWANSILAFSGNTGFDS